MICFSSSARRAPGLFWADWSAAEELAFAENLFERADLGEIEITRSAAHLAGRVKVIGPDKKGKELIRGHGQFFEGEEVVGLPLFMRSGGMAEVQGAGFFSRERITQAIGAQANIIGHLGAERDFFERSDLLVAAG
jgi:hypothetical protein